MRPGARELQDDDVYLGDAVASVRELEKLAGLAAQSTVLDLGCGPGRLAVGLLATGLEVRYVGIDVNRAAVDWAERNLASQDDRLRFVHVDASNARYNASGTAPVELPLPDDYCDLVVLFSVFSHMLLGDIQSHLREISRVLRPGGRVYATAFVEDDVPDEEENPAGYFQLWSGPLHCVRLGKAAFEDLVHGAGFVVEAFEYRRHRGLQSVYVLRYPGGQ